MTEHPLIIEHRKHYLSPSTFEPTASLIVTQRLRTDGVLARLSAEEARVLFAVLTFLTPNGVLHANSHEIGAALGISEHDAAATLERLARTTWHEEPILYRIGPPDSLPTYAVSPHMVAHEEVEPAEDHAPALPSHAADVIEHSRTAYSTPREEAERLILEQLGHDPEELADSREGAARRTLLALGVSKETVSRLIAEYPLEEIEQQLVWLPERGARNKARFIVAAIEGHYDPPASFEASATAPNRSGDSVSLPVPATDDGGSDA